jgi:hypothetical protein
MPPLKDTLRSTSPEGYAPEIPKLALPAPVGQTNPSGAAKINPYLRCPLPPINAGPDTLRQFNENSDVPHRRVLPLPASPGGGTFKTVNNTTIVQAAGSGTGTGGSGGSGGGTGGTPTLTTKTVMLTTPLLAVGASSLQTLGMSSKSFQFISISSTAPCEIRIYGSATAQIADASRTTDSPPPAELGNDIITDIVLDTAPCTWNWQNRVGANNGSPQTPNAYITVFNIGGSSIQARITLVFLPLESS